MSNEKIYAKVHDNGYIEYPVYLQHILARNQSVNDYQEVIEGRKPKLPEFHEYKTDLYVYDGRVRLDYLIQPIPLSSLLNSISISNIDDLTLNPTDIFYSDVDPALVARIQKLAGEYIDEKLNNFVAERNFKSIESAVTYADDANLVLAASGARAKAVRSEVYTAMNIYLANIVNNTNPIPKSLAEIDANIPPMTWE